MIRCIVQLKPRGADFFFGLTHCWKTDAFFTPFMRTLR